MLCDEEEFQKNLLEKEKILTEKIHEEKFKYNKLEANNILKISELEGNYKKIICDKDNEIHSLNSKVRELNDNNERHLLNIDNYQKEIDEILEQADEKITSMKLEHEEATQKINSNNQQIIIDIRSKLNNEKQLELQNLKLNFDSEKRNLTLINESKLNDSKREINTWKEKLENEKQNFNKIVNNFGS